MAMSYEDYLARRSISPESRSHIEAHKEQMLTEVRAYRLRELREQAGLTQQQLAQRIGVGQRQVSKIEHGDPGVRLGSLLAVVRVLGLTDKLLTNLDPYESDLGRASADRILPQRVRR